MKNITLGVNAVLALAVAILFYLHFSSSKKLQQLHQLLPL